MKIHPIKAFTDNYIWALHAENSNQLLVVDPGDAKPVIDYIESTGSNLSAILITHHHNDHIGGVRALKEKYGCQVYASNDEQFDFCDQPLSKDNALEIFDGLLTFNILHLPGHTLKHIAYHEPKHNILFCGDTLFRAGCGRMFEGTPEQFHASLQQLAMLPKETKVYCTHEYTLSNLAFAQFIEPDNKKIETLTQECQSLRESDIATLPSTIESELETNPFLRCHLPNVQTRLDKLSGKNHKKNYEFFASMRRLKDKF